jgi:hypothetical protein
MVFAFGILAAVFLLLFCCDVPAAGACFSGILPAACLTVGAVPLGVLFSCLFVTAVCLEVCFMYICTSPSCIFMYICTRH